MGQRFSEAIFFCFFYFWPLEREVFRRHSSKNTHRQRLPCSNRTLTRSLSLFRHNSDERPTRNNTTKNFSLKIISWRSTFLSLYRILDKMRLLPLFSMVMLGLVGSLVPAAEAGFRCSIGQFVCTASCVTLGHSSGKLRRSGPNIIHFQSHWNPSIDQFYVAQKGRSPNFETLALWNIWSGRYQMTSS